MRRVREVLRDKQFRLCVCRFLLVERSVLQALVFSPVEERQIAYPLDQVFPAFELEFLAWLLRKYVLDMDGVPAANLKLVAFFGGPPMLFDALNNMASVSRS